MGWAYLISLAHSDSFFDFEEDKIPRIVFYRHRLLTLIVRSSYPIKQNKESGTLSALPFLVKDREFYKLMQLILVESRNEDCDDYLN
ncbi:hypothetical protein Lal_00042270 [Lupinus albus]|nr:hypothetical protein Lal_00042270 [Lupinus albus]